MTDRMPTSSAACTAQIAPSLAVSCTTGAGLPITAGMNSVTVPYQPGIHTVNR